MKTLRLLFLTLTLALATHVARAGSATWDLNPATNDWNSAANWTPATVPNGTSDIATFGLSNVTDPTFSVPTSLGGIVFNAGASAYTIAFGHGRTLNFYGAGITNNSGVTQTMVLDAFRGVVAQIVFHNSSSAGDETIYSVDAPNLISSLFFEDSSSAGSSSINLAGGSDIYGSHMTFATDSTAASANITVNGGLTNAAQGADATFFDQATSDHATITAHGGAVAGAGGGIVVFAASGSSTAADATLIADGSVAGADGGFLSFLGTSEGGTSRIELSGNGTLDLTGRTSHTLTIGSLEGDGIVSLGKVNLTVGSNSLSTVFSGMLQDGTGGGPGMLTKVGTGTLTLTGANSLTGGVTMSAGTLVAANGGGSATGPGSLQVNSGTVGGSGTVATASFGTGAGSGAVLAPAAGTNKNSTFTVTGQLTLKSDATYLYTARAKGRKIRTDKVVAGSVTISQAAFTFQSRIVGTLAAGTTLTVISNLSSLPISGTFSNLPDGAILTVGSNKFQASYEGGDGNDLTLTVVP
ncbi:MAG: autotransporter-associated beta strand repeat-containing protein [Chthoniobacterales bacterium]|nr:autotransporter-associated beta strand repeat-containing protein [Chthoniobacterales bacterium]